MEDFVAVLKELNESGTKATEAGKEERKEKAAKFVEDLDTLYGTIEGAVIDTIKTMTREGKGYGVVYEATKNDTNMLSTRWVPWIMRHFPERAVTIRSRLEDYIKSNCNGGVDPNTNLPYAVSIMTRKGTGSLPLGVVISRKGIRYDVNPSVPGASSRAATNGGVRGGRGRGSRGWHGRGFNAGNKGSTGYPPLRVATEEDPILGPPRSIPTC